MSDDQQTIDSRRIRRNSLSNNSFIYGKNSIYDCNRSPAMSIFSIYSNFSLSSYSSKSSHNVQRIETRFKFNKVKPENSIKKNNWKKKVFKKGGTNYPHLTQIIKQQAKTSLKVNYKLMDNVLGSGSGGTVYLVERRNDKKLFAAKVFKRRGDHEEKISYWERVSNEIYIGSIVHNENCIKVIDIVNFHGCIVQIMEYCTKDLFSIIEFQKLDVSQINSYFVQLVFGVNYLHGYGIGHRDLKLENLCIGEDEKLKIVDFGCAKVFKAGMDSFLINSDGLYGSDYYHAPESFSLEPRDVRKTDTWAIGIIYLAMYTKRFPWKSSHMSDKDYKGYLSNRELFLKELDLPEEVIPLLLLMLEPDHLSRPTLIEIIDHPIFVFLDSTSLTFSSSVSSFV